MTHTIIDPILFLTEDESLFEDIVGNIKNRFDKNFECSICNEIFINPWITNCGHTFCKQCIETWRNSNHENHEFCPNCRAEVTLISPNQVLKIFIEDFINDLFSEEAKKSRTELISDRLRSQPIPQTPPRNPSPEYRISVFRQDRTPGMPRTPDGTGTPYLPLAPRTPEAQVPWWRGHDLDTLRTEFPNSFGPSGTPDARAIGSIFSYGSIHI